MVQVKSNSAAASHIAVNVNATGSGNLIVVGTVNSQASDNVTSISDNATGGSNSYVSAKAKGSDTNGGSTEIWYAKNSKAGATQVDVQEPPNVEDHDRSRG
jgi:hypothetical protein